jgi:hypothetical protein
VFLKVKLLCVSLVILVAASVAFVSMGRQGNSIDQVEIITLPEQIELAEPNRAEKITKALVAAYPRRVLKAEFRNGDWAVLLRDTWYYYAEGRFLPEELLHRVAEYEPVLFYEDYPRELPPWSELTSEQIRWIHEITERRNARTRPRSHYFFDALYRAHNHNEAYERVKTIRFLGNNVTVHYSILGYLSLVEEHILAASRTNAQVQAWINNINNLAGWSWREVADTQARSFHSYGAAIDILPRSLGGREIYWLWASNHRQDWWNIPFERRYHPPNAVIQAFESYGFVWGGKWPFFDTMHFEFRPEIFILNNIELSTLF